MSKEYIEREAVIAAIKDLPFQQDIEDLSIYEEIKEVPSADVEPVRHGEWKRHKDHWCCRYICSNCEKPARYDMSYEQNLSNYCPNCGAKMDGGNK